MPPFIMRLRKRITTVLLLLLVVLILFIVLVALFLVRKPTVRSNDPYTIHKEESYTDVLRRWYNYSDSGELSVFYCYLHHVY
jgi:uncharacterized protein YxeA